MPAYTYDPGLVFDNATSLPAKSAVGVLYDRVGGTVQQVYDLLGNALPNLTTSPDGYVARFKADIATGVVSFGAVSQPVISVEAQNAAPQAAAAQAAAEAAATAAQAAADRAAGGTAATASQIDARLGGPAGGLLDSAGKVVAAKLPDLSGTFATKDASSLTSGVLPAARVPDLSGMYATKDASSLTSGVLAAARIPDLSGTYTTTASMPKRTTVADLPTPAYFAHQGGANLAPNNSMEAFRHAFGMPGALPLDTDIKVTFDGAMPLFHDVTTGGVTTTSANVMDIHGAAVQRLRMDPARWFCSTWADTLRLPDFRDMLREFGGKRVLVVEVESLLTQGDTDGRAGQAVANEIVAWGLQKSILAQSGSTANLQPFINAGITTLRVSGYGQHGNDINLTTDAALGVKWVGIDSLDPANGASFIASAHAKGLKVAVYALDRRVDRDKWISYGVDAIWSNDPWYLNGSAPRRTTDPFASQTYHHGHLAAAVNSSIASPRGYFAGGGWGLDVNVQTGVFASVLQGWGSPIKGDPACPAFTLDFTLTFDAVESSGTWASVFIGPQNDTEYDDTAASGRPNGYHILFRQNGAIDVYKVTNSAATKLGGVIASAAPVIGTGAACKIVVTSTTITASYPNGGTTNSYTATDSSYRGGFFHFCVSNAKARFSGVSIT